MLRRIRQGTAGAPATGGVTGSGGTGGTPPLACAVSFVTPTDGATFDETDTTCCYALQDKVWVHDPAGAPWEVNTVKDDNPAETAACC